MSNRKKNGLPYRLFTSVWRWKWLLLLSTLLVAAIVAYASVSESLAWAGSYIKLDYDSAHDGLAPNGTRFNIYDIKSERLMTRALELTGLDDAMTWWELADCLVVAPTRTQSVSKRYIATEYSAELTRTDAFGSVSARSMLDVICRLYYQDFLRQNGVNHAQLNVDWTVLDEMEYAEIGEFIRSRANILRQFLQARIDQSGGYESENPAQSFRALLNTVGTFQTVYIDKYSAFIEQSRLYRNASLYQNKLTYQRMLIDQSYQLSRAQFANREQALNEYQESLIAIVMVPTYYAGNGLYMSRTQTGIDTLTNEAETYSSISQKQALKLDKIDASIASLTKAQGAATLPLPTQEERQAAATVKAEALIDDITTQFDALIQAVTEADEAYAAYTVRDYVSFPQASLSLTSAYGLKRTAMAAGSWFVLAALLLFAVDQRRQARAASVPAPKGGAQK